MAKVLLNLILIILTMFIVLLRSLCIGVVENPIEAFKWLQRGADALSGVGECYGDGKGRCVYQDLRYLFFVMSYFISSINYPYLYFVSCSPSF